VGAASDITLGAALSNTAGHTSLSAARSVVQNANITATGTGKTVDLLAGVAITMGAGAIIGTQNGNVLLTAVTGNVTLESITAGSANVAMTAGGSIVDRDTAGDSVVDIAAAGLILNAGTGIGAGANSIETSVLTLAATSIANSIYLRELDAITVTHVSASVQRVNSQAGSSLATQELSDLSTWVNGNIELVSKGGSISLEDGLPSNGVAVQANGSGTVLLKTLGSASDIIATADIVSGSGSIDLLAARSANLSAAVDIRTLAAVYVLATAGNVVMPDARISSGSSHVTVIAEGTLVPGVVQTTGEVSMDVGATGEVVFNRPVDRLGENIIVSSNSVDIFDSLLSVGADLVVAPLPSASTPVDIRIGGVETEAVELHLSLGEIYRIEDGFNLITFGSSTQKNQSIVVEGKDDSGIAKAVVFKDPVLFDISATDGHLRMQGQIIGEALTIKGTGSTTTLSDTETRMQGAILIDDSVILQGGSTISAGFGGVGDLTITGKITGSDITSNDTLTLSANGGDVILKKAISAIDALTITSAIDVIFEESVDISGALEIHATGDVNFNQAINLTAGGTLSIVGAKSITFANGVTVSGDITLDAQSLELLGGANSLTSTLYGSTLTITSASDNHNIVIGNAVGQEIAGQLNLTSRDVMAIGDNFIQVVIGELGRGAITVVGNTDLTSTNAASIEVLGNTITLQSGNLGGALQVPGDISLRASSNVLLNSGISTAVAGHLSAISDNGSLIMAQGTRLDSRGGDIDLAGTTMAVATVNAWSTDLSVGGIVSIDAGSGTVTDANRNSTADIFAKAVDFTGYGPSITSAENVLEVVAEVVQISAPQGLVVRDTGADGRTYFNLMNGGQLYRQMVVEGTDVARVTEKPADLLTRSDSELIAAGIPSTSSLLTTSISGDLSAAVFAFAPASFSSPAASRYLASSDTIDLLAGDVVLNGIDANGLTGDANLLSDNSYGLANRLQQSYILGTPGEQPLVSGLDTFSQDNFEYWVETLSL
jgi:hypothetical protein